MSHPLPDLVRAEVIVVGAGVAGMMAALHAGPRRVLLLSDRPVGRAGSSVLAQGGVAAALGAEDSPGRHARDTLRAAGGLADPAVVELVTREGPRRIREVISMGARFDRGPSGTLDLGREGAHSVRRIVHASGDATGAELSRALAEAVRRRGNIRVLQGFRAGVLLELDGTVIGLVAVTPAGAPLLLVAPSVILATGGLGHLYRRTTNPPEVRGLGLALAGRAGAVLADLEMVQFHPTALADGSDPAPLLTEALRGEGAVLVDQEGRRVMDGVHPAGDLAPRDVVSRELWRRIRRGGRIFLDATALGRDLARRFPTVHELCRARGLDPTVEPVPVAPAAHYHMGGILVDHHGRTTVRGLWAAGEVACTGLHGANRLASNSLLEALVFGARAGEDTAARLAVVPREREIRAAWKKLVAEAGSSFTGEAWRRVEPGLRRILWEHAGVERDGEGLRQGLGKLERLTAPAPPAAAAHVARWLLRSALERRSSRGAHLRTDADPADDGLYRVLVARGRVHRQRPAWLQGAGRARAGQ